jgi:hypothetical protein
MVPDSAVVDVDELDDEALDDDDVDAVLDDDVLAVVPAELPDPEPPHEIVVAMRTSTSTAERRRIDRT